MTGLLYMVAIVLTTIIRRVHCDYECVCNYNVEQSVLPMPDESSQPLGFMYEFDCKPTAEQGRLDASEWLAIAFEHKLGYIQTDGQVQQQICPGEPPSFDVFTTTPTIPPTTTNVKPSPTTAVSLVTIIPTKTSTLPNTFPDYTDLFTKSTARETTSHSTRGTGTASIVYQSNTETKTYALTTLASISISAMPVSKFTNVSPSNTTVPKATVPINVGTDVLTTSKVTYLTPTPIPTTQSTAKSTTTTRLPSTLPPIIGDINLCPSQLLTYTKQDGGALTQYGSKCYELVPTKLIWTKAELDCQAKGGHLLSIHTKEIQEYIHTWVNRFIAVPGIWLGISNKRQHGQFEWISGDIRNEFWYSDNPGHIRDEPDKCGLMMFSYPMFGKLVPVSCGRTTPSGDQGSQYAFICEYPIQDSQQSNGQFVGK